MHVPVQYFHGHSYVARPSIDYSLYVYGDLTIVIKQPFDVDHQYLLPSSIISFIHTERLANPSLVMSVFTTHPVYGGEGTPYK